MISWADRLALCCAGAVLAQAAASLAQGMEGVRLPFDHYPDGSVKTQIRAQTAKVSEKGEIEANRVRVEFLSPAGEVEEMILLNECRCNREKKTLISESKIRMEKKGLVVTGTGIRWNGEDQVVRILDNVRVVLDHTVGIGGIKK